MDPSAKTFLFDLLSTPSPTGFETAGQKKWLQYVRPFARSVDHDAYGSAWATLPGKGKSPIKLMLEAHADEIGFMVKYITKEGFIHLDRMGGSDHAVARGRRVFLQQVENSRRRVGHVSARFETCPSIGDTRTPARYCEKACASSRA